METYSRKKGRIIVVILILILVLPACYGLVKEFFMKRKAPANTVAPVSGTDSLK